MVGQNCHSYNSSRSVPGIEWCFCTKQTLLVGFQLVWGFLVTYGMSTGPSNHHREPHSKAWQAQSLHTEHGNVTTWNVTTLKGTSHLFSCIEAMQTLPEALLKNVSWDAKKSTMVFALERKSARGTPQIKSKVHPSLTVVVDKHQSFWIMMYEWEVTRTFTHMPFQEYGRMEAAQTFHPSFRPLRSRHAVPQWLQLYTHPGIGPGLLCGSTTEPQQ